MTDPKVKHRHIVVVDDEKSICEIIASYLTGLGYTVYQANCAEDAITTIQKEKVDLVLTDIKMPGLTGVELLKWIKEYNAFLPVIMTTGFPTLDTAISALKSGAYDYLTKPFHLEEVGEKVFRALQARQLEEDNLLFSKLVSLHEVTKVLSSTHDIGELNKLFLDYSVKLSRSNGGSLMLFDSDLNLYTALATPPPYHEDFWDKSVFSVASKWAVDNGESLAIKSTMNNIPEDFPALPEDIQSYIVFPLKTPKKVIGALNLIRVQDKIPFSNVELEITNVLASQTSISFENARLYQNIRENYLKTIRGFATAVEAKDKYTLGHSENVMKYTVVIARHLNLPESEIEQIMYAGLLHDVGKIGVDESILNKPGRLTPEEFDEIKKHPVLGCRILSDVPFFDSLIPLIRHHHEFYNGNGYPDGLANGQIPYGARILSVADAFEAMTSNRPYRKAMPLEVALNIIKEEKGKQFDPDIVEAFLEVIEAGSIEIIV